MGMIDRYKKRGGFLQLVQLLETMGSEKREKFLQSIAQESPVWDTAIRQKMLSLDRMSKWAAPYLMEFLPTIPPALIATALIGLTEEKRVNFIASLGFAGKKACEEFFKEGKPKPNEIASAQIKIINEARNSIALGKLKLDKCDPELVIPENYEDKLASSSPVDMVMESLGDAPADVSVPAATGGGGGAPVAPGAMGEEVNLLRRKLVALTQENNRLQKELNEYKSKIEGVKAALSKSAA